MAGDCGLLFVARFGHRLDIGRGENEVIVDPADLPRLTGVDVGEARLEELWEASEQARATPPKTQTRDDRTHP